VADGEHSKGAAKTAFLSAYLSGWVYWVSMPIGATALLMIHYLVKTSWGLLLKRSFEATTRTLPLMLVLFVPIAFALMMGENSPYWWVAPEQKEINEAAPPPKAPEGDAAMADHEAKLAERR